MVIAAVLFSAVFHFREASCRSISASSKPWALNCALVSAASTLSVCSTAASRAAWASSSLVSVVVPAASSGCPRVNPLLISLCGDALQTYRQDLPVYRAGRRCFGKPSGGAGLPAAFTPQFHDVTNRREVLTMQTAQRPESA